MADINDMTTFEPIKVDQKLILKPSDENNKGRVVVPTTPTIRREEE